MGYSDRLLGTFYAVLIGYVLFLGLQAGLQKRIGEEVDSSIVTEVLLVIVYCTVVTAVSFSILESSIGTPTT